MLRLHALPVPVALPFLGALLLGLGAAGCRGVSRAQMASMPLDRYAIEYYLLSER